MRAITVLMLVISLSGCAAVVSGPQAMLDGTYVVTVVHPRLSLSVIDSVDEALAEARFKCASIRRQFSMVYATVAPRAPLGGDRKAEVRFACTCSPDVDRPIDGALC